MKRGFAKVGLLWQIFPMIQRIRHRWRLSTSVNRRTVLLYSDTKFTLDSRYKISGHAANKPKHFCFRFLYESNTKMLRIPHRVKVTKSSVKTYQTKDRLKQIVRIRHRDHRSKKTTTGGGQLFPGNFCLSQKSSIHVMLCYVILFAKQQLQKRKEKREKKKWRGDLTETIGAYERFGLLELRVRAV